MNKLLKFSALMLVITALYSCKKTETPEEIAKLKPDYESQKMLQYLENKTFTLVSIIQIGTTANVIGDVVFPSCVADNILTFKSGQEISWDFGKEKCRVPLFNIYYTGVTNDVDSIYIDGVDDDAQLLFGKRPNKFEIVKLDRTAQIMELGFRYGNGRYIRKYTFK